MAVEASLFPPAGVEYSFLEPVPQSLRLIRSPIKGYYRKYESSAHDLIEAVLSPPKTRNPWIYSCENLQAPAAFNVLGLPLPRSVRVACIKHLLLRDNCRRVVFWSHAGKATLQSYGGIDDERLLRKVTVVHPAVRAVADSAIRYRDDSAVRLLFSGDFFRKGGANVIDAFEIAQQQYPSIQLRVCCDESIDFNTPNVAMRQEYLARMAANPGIRMMGRIPRQQLVEEVLPDTDIYLLPTYAETFGMSLLEAMAFGIPVIATNHFAIPEMIDDEVSGLLIDTARWDADRLFKGYVVDQIPADFREHVTAGVLSRLLRLIESAQLRKTIGRAALAVARSRFSFETRNSRMLEIYRTALGDG